MKTLSSVLTCAVLAATIAPACADTLATWNGATGNWSTAADWSTAPQIPVNNSPAGTLYDVAITAGQVTLDSNPTVQQLTWANATLTTGSLTVKGGITLAGQFDYLGSAAGAATLTNSAGQTATLGAAGNAYLELANNSSFLNAGTFSAVSGGIFNNGGGGTFTNSGTFAVNLPQVGSFFNSGSGIAFANAGTVNVNTGTLVLNGDGGATAGSFQVASTGALNLNGNFSFSPSSTITGNGYLNFLYGTFTFRNPAPISVPNVNFAGGTITAPSALAIASGITWSGGTFANASFTLSGNVTIASTQSVYISAANVTFAPGTTNTLGGSGNVTLQLQNAGTFTNAGTLTLSNGSVANNGGGGRFNNTGTITCTLPAGNTFTIAAGVSFNNSGTVNISSGTLVLNGGDTGATSGTFNISANAILRFGGNVTLTSTTTFAGNGMLDISAGVTSLSSGLVGVPALSIEGTLRNTADGSNAGTSKLATLSLSGSGKFNLGANKLILEPAAASKAASLSTLQTAVNAGKTSGTGVVASSLPANEGLAVADNAVLVTPRTSFGGIPVNSADILVGPELLGDANFDGKVDVADLRTVLNHLGAATPFWTNGNFDGAATIDLNDLNFVLNNLGASLTAATNSLTLNPAAPTTPEPATGALLLPLAAWILRPRKRSEA